MTVRLTSIAPEFAREIAELLEQQGESILASQIADAEIVDRCRCGDSFCATFYLRPEPQGAYPPPHRNVMLDSAVGMVVLDVVGDEIMAVEVLNNPGFREALLRAVP